MPAPPFQNILVPTDFSDLSALALRYAAAIARCSRAKLTLLHANTFSPPAYFTETYVKELERQFRASFAEAEKGLDKFAAATVGSAAGLEKRVEEGLPADAIVRYASAEGIDLVAMGTHGRSGFNRCSGPSPSACCAPVAFRF
jgi:nucleotide-binding universal stress UspA family protein